MAVKASATITLSFMVDVKAVYRYYKLQASTTSAPSVPTSFPPTGWTDSEPTYTEGSTNTLYTVDCNVFTDDSFIYTPVSKSTSYEAAKAAYNKAVNAQNAANSKIASVDVEYYLSTSSTSLAGGSWQTTAPIWVNGKYMWSRTKKVDGAGNVTYSPSETGTCIAGATGATGATGKGVKSIVEQYYQSTSSTSQTGGSWSTTVPAWADGKYIWTRSVITYTDSSSVTTNAVCVTGQKGSTGAIGNGISSISYYYATTTSQTAPSASNITSTSIPTMSATNKYLWQKEVISYTNGTSKTSVLLIAVYGDKGATGATGTGISSITEEYYLSTSKTEQTGGSWTTTPPTWSSGKYIWIRNKIVYTNPDSTVYTTPICDSAWEAVNEVQVGGRNLTRDSKEVTIWYCKYGSNQTHSVQRNGNTYTVNGRTITNPYEVSFVSGGTGDMQFGTQSANGDATECKYDLSYKTYTMSVWVMSDTDVTLESWVTRQYKDSDGSNTSHGLTANKWIRITHSRTFNDRSDLDGVRVRFSCASTCKIVFCLGKVELGNKATDWTPAPEDVDTDINEAAKTATNFMQFVDGEGLYVGNKQTGTWEGVRTRMDSDSFDVIDQDGNTLASYGAEMSITPNNTSGYKIKMGNAVTIGTRFPGSTEGYGSVVIGYNGRATASYSYAEGYQTLASESYAHAEGQYSTASGNYSHAEGYNTTASGNGSHTEGIETTASGLDSHAEGYSTTASGHNSHSEGLNTTASGYGSHAEGCQTTASGDNSHAEGYITTASGNYSHASGEVTRATKTSQFVIGRCNAENDNAVFIIGNGSYSEDSEGITYDELSNALEVDWNGNLTASGNIYYNIPVCGSAYDVDTMKTTGKYYCGVVSNKPPEPGNASGSNGWLEVMRYTDDYVHQRYTTYTGNVYERNCINGTWGQWRIVYFHYAMEQSAAETLVVNFLSKYPYTININACNTADVPGAVYSYTVQYRNTSAAAKVSANTAALSSTYGTITASKSGVTIKSTAGYRLYVTVTQ